MLSIYLGLHRTPKPLAIVSLSGRFVDAAATGGPRDLAPVFLAHGTRDPMIPFTESDVAERELKARGAAVERLTRPGMGHEVDAVVLRAAIDFLARALVRS